MPESNLYKELNKLSSENEKLRAINLMQKDDIEHYRYISEQLEHFGGNLRCALLEKEKNICQLNSVVESWDRLIESINDL